MGIVDILGVRVALNLANLKLTIGLGDRETRRNLFRVSVFLAFCILFAWGYSNRALNPFVSGAMVCAGVVFMAAAALLFSEDRPAAGGDFRAEFGRTRMVKYKETLILWHGSGKERPAKGLRANWSARQKPNTEAGYA